MHVSQSNSREVLKLLQVAEDIADGLCRLTECIYDLDPRTKDARKGAYAALSEIANVRQKYDLMLDDGREWDQ